MERNNPEPNSNPIPPNPKPSSHQSPSTRATSKSVKFKGVWIKKTKESGKKKKDIQERIRYGVEIAHKSITNERGKIWLGTYDTPEQGALAYDIAALKIKGKAPNQTLRDNGDVKIDMDPSVKESIRREVEKKISGQFRSSDGSNKGESSGSDKSLTRRRTSR